MIITNEIKTRKIKFIKTESETGYYPSHRIQIKVETENLQGSFDYSIWLSDSAIEKFLIELDALDQSRKGQAILESMTPEEMKLTFKLTFKSIDTLGHLSVRLQYRKEDRMENDYSYEIKVVFQIDPTSLPTIRKEIIKLMNYPHQRWGFQS